MLVGLGELVVSFGIVFVDLDGVQELDGGLSVFALGAEALSAFQVSHLLHVWIAMAPGQQDEGNEKCDQGKIFLPSHRIPPAIGLGEPPALPGWQQKFDISGSRAWGIFLVVDATTYEGGRV
jgi:hypothetical protein